MCYNAVGVYKIADRASLKITMGEIFTEPLTVEVH
jgi:hypothetical protein